MLSAQSEEQLASRVTAALSSGNIGELRSITTELSAASPFLYSLLRDTLGVATQAGTRHQPDELSRVIAVRMQSVAHWRRQGNETIAAVEAGEIDADAIKPHVRLEPAASDKFYDDQSEQIGAALSSVERAGREVDCIAAGLGPNVNHAFRSTHAVNLIETLLGTIKALVGGSEPIRWIDIGCGTGRFANSVNPRRFGVEIWEIVGCDQQEGKIAVANRQRTRGRSFIAADAFAILDEHRTRGESFHLVSMFEFLEHLDDPLRFIRQLDAFAPKFVLAASPLEQKMAKPLDATPDRAHLWSFSRRGWEQMFELAGLEVVYSSEIRVGSYIGGLDWLSIVCGPRDQLRDRRQSLESLATRDSSVAPRRNRVWRGLSAVLPRARGAKAGSLGPNNSSDGR